MNQAVAEPVKASSGLGTFERYLSVWVAFCMVAGVVLGKLLPAAMAALRGIEFGKGSQINAPIAVLIWLMITPMMKVDFSSVLRMWASARRFEGVLLPKFAPVTIAALLATLVLIFAFQADNITDGFSMWC